MGPAWQRDAQRGVAAVMGRGAWAGRARWKEGSGPSASKAGRLRAVRGVEPSCEQTGCASVGRCEVGPRERGRGLGRARRQAGVACGLGLGRWFGLGLGLSFVLGFLPIFSFFSISKQIKV